MLRNYDDSKTTRNEQRAGKSRVPARATGGCPKRRTEVRRCSKGLCPLRTYGVASRYQPSRRGDCKQLTNAYKEKQPMNTQ